MQYQLLANFGDGRPSVVVQAKDERSAFDIFSSISQVAGIKAVSMVGIKHEYLGQGDPRDPPPVQARPVAAMRDAQEPMEMGPPQPPPEAQSQPQPYNGHHEDQPRWAKVLMSSATASLPPPAQVPIAVAQTQVVGGGGHKTPLEEYGGEIQLGRPSESKRFKRAVEMVPPPRTPVAHEQPPASQPIAQSTTQTPAVFGMDAPGHQGFLRPFSKTDADTLTQAKQLLETSMATKMHSPGRSPTDIASHLMQRYLPHLANVDWGQQPSFRADYLYLLVTCQKILTGQATGDAGQPTEK